MRRLDRWSRAVLDWWWSCEGYGRWQGEWGKRSFLILACCTETDDQRICLDVDRACLSRKELNETHYRRLIITLTLIWIWLDCSQSAYLVGMNKPHIGERQRGSRIASDTGHVVSLPFAQLAQGRSWVLRDETWCWRNRRSWGRQEWCLRSFQFLNKSSICDFSRFSTPKQHQLSGTHSHPNRIVIVVVIGVNPVRHCHWRQSLEEQGRIEVPSKVEPSQKMLICISDLAIVYPPA